MRRFASYKRCSIRLVMSLCAQDMSTIASCRPWNVTSAEFCPGKRKDANILRKRLLVKPSRLKIESKTTLSSCGDSLVCAFLSFILRRLARRCYCFGHEGGKFAWLRAEIMIWGVKNRRMLHGFVAVCLEKTAAGLLFPSFHLFAWSYRCIVRWKLKFRFSQKIKSMRKFRCSLIFLF